jgi:hypothetical protein
LEQPQLFIILKEYFMKSRLLFVSAAFSKTGSGQKAANFYYEAKNGEVTITGYKGSTKDVAIPGRIYCKPVTKIDIGAFSCNKLTSVTIPDSVTYIGMVALAGNQLASVTIPNSVTCIENGAFSCNKLTSVTVPGSITYIGGGAFSKNRLASVTIPDSVTVIRDGAFAYNQLTCVTIPADVEVAEDSFDGCFASFYTQGGRQAGTYTFSDREMWKRQ